MKSVNRLLLGSAAGLFVVADAQAADLPAKAQPAEYVKVCSLYGAGFWYIPGTDTCIKIGGTVFMMVMENASGQTNAPIGTPTSNQADAGGAFNRAATNYLNTHERGALSMDVRTQTDYGTARSYVSLGADWSTASYNGTLNPNSGHGDGRSHKLQRCVRRPGLRAICRLHRRPYPFFLRYYFALRPYAAQDDRRHLD